MHLPFGVTFALLIRRALPRGDLVEGPPFRFHPHVGVPRQHGTGDVPGDANDHLVARARLSARRGLCRDGVSAQSEATVTDVTGVLSQKAVSGQCTTRRPTGQNPLRRMRWRLFDARNRELS